MSKRIRPAAEIRRRNRLESQTANRGDIEKNLKGPRQPPVSLPAEDDFGAADTLLRQAGYEYTPDPMGRLDRGAWTDRDGQPLTSVARERILAGGRRAGRPDRARPVIPFSDLSPEDQEILSDRPGTRRPEEETDVAVAPLAIPAVALLARFLPPAIAAYRASQMLPPPVDKVPGLPEVRGGAPKDAMSPRAMTDPLPPTPPFPSASPEGPGDGKYETPADKVEGGVLVNPLPPGLRPEDTVTIFPDQSDLFPDLFYEYRRGTPPIRLLNTNIRDLAERIVEQTGLSAKHIGGARDKDGNEKPETWLRPAKAEKGVRRGGSYLDLTFKSVKTKRRLLINTVDTRADGFTDTTRELNAMTRVIYNSENGDLYVMIPKLGPGQTLNEEALRAFLEPLLRELDNDKPDIDPRDGNAPADLIRRFRHG